MISSRSANLINDNENIGKLLYIINVYKIMLCWKLYLINEKNSKHLLIFTIVTICKIFYGNA